MSAREKGKVEEIYLGKSELCVQLVRIMSSVRPPHMKVKIRAALPKSNE